MSSEVKVLLELANGISKAYKQAVNELKEMFMCMYTVNFPKLKPCPFCGNKAVIRTIEPHTHNLVNIPDHPGSVFIECSNCTCAISADNRKEAIKLWNRRCK